MRMVNRALAPVLVVGLVLPSAAAAQEPGGPVGAARVSERESLGDVRLTFESGHRANPWAVFGGGVAAVGYPQPGVRIGDAPAPGSSAGLPRLAGARGASPSPAKAQRAAKRWAGQGSASGFRKGLGIVLGVAAVVGYLILMAIASTCADNPQGCSVNR